MRDSAAFLYPFSAFQERSVLTRTPFSSTSLRGTITAAFGRHYEVLIPATATDVSRLLRCVPRGKKSIHACGDIVDIELTSENEGVIVATQPRLNLLWRSDAFRQKLIAANLTLVVIVVATEPSFSPQFISRCLAAAESEQLRALIVLNKSDLSDRLDAAREQLAPFSSLGYALLEVSALGDLAPLRAALRGKRSIFVGQSGMGKSTLTNALIPTAAAATAEISTALDSGKHTTTLARMYPFEDGWIIDSPGMQAFGLAHLEETALAESFIEFRDHLGACRFRDCEHEAEPGCAVRAAVENGAIHPVRFEHFQLIRAEIRSAARQRRGW